MRATGIILALILGTSAAVASGAELEAPYKISRARFATEDGWFVVRIDTAAPWAHWTLANPARIIVDLGDAVTEMPNAPGLYEMEMPEGPVRRLRTSQFMNTALDRRVRFTFELDKIAVYEARRVGSYIEVRITDRERAPRSWELTSAGFHETTPAATPLASGTASADAFRPLGMHALTSGPVARNEDASASTASAGREVKAQPAPEVRAQSAPEVTAQPAPNRAPSRLSDALAAAFDAAKTQPSNSASSVPAWSDSKGRSQSGAEVNPSAKDAHDARKDDTQVNAYAQGAAEDGAAHSQSAKSTGAAQDDHPAQNTGAASDGAKGNASRSSSAKNDGSGVPDTAANSGGIADEGLDEARISLEQLLGAQNVDQVREVHGKMIEDEFTSSAHLDPGLIPDSLGSIVEDEYALDQPAEPTDVVRERAARRILDEAVGAWTAGNASRAVALCERVRRHYELHPSAQQSLVLEREIHLAAGDRALAAALPAYPVLPDSGVVPLAGFLRLLDEHWKLEQVDQIERLAETWVSFYPGGTWLGRTRFALGEHYYRNRDLLRAERYLSAIAPDDSLGAHALAMRARLHDEAGDKAGALALYETLATLDPGPYQLRGLARTADLQFQSGEVDSALAAYRVIETSAPDDTETPWAIFQIGNCHVLLGDTSSAARAYEKVISAYPASYWAEAARSQLQSLEWQRGLARQVEGMRGR